MDSIDIGMYITYFLFGLALISAIVLPAINIAKSPAGLVKSLFGIGGLAVLFGVAYALSGSEVTAKAAALGVSATSSKMIGAGLTLFYFVLFISIIGVIYSEINKALK
jgi:uncharacterized membrane protein